MKKADIMRCDHEAGWWCVCGSWGRLFFSLYVYSMYGLEVRNGKERTASPLGIRYGSMKGSNVRANSVVKLGRAYLAVCTMLLAFVYSTDLKSSCAAQMERKLQACAFALLGTNNCSFKLLPDSPTRAFLLPYRLQVLGFLCTSTCLPHSALASRWHFHAVERASM